MSLLIRSSAFSHGGEIPRKHGYKNGNTSPPLDITDIPPDAKSLALIMDDPDAMGAVGKVWTHWLVWDIPPSAADFAEGRVPRGAVEGRTDFDQTGYGGPAPPDKEHTYVFKIYALDSTLGLPVGSNKDELEDAIKNHVIKEARLEGRYSP